MKKLTLVLLCSFPTITYANNYYFSPDLKIGAFHGVGLQLGTTGRLGMDAVYASISHKVYSTERYEESINSYRLGFQHQVTESAQNAVQVELGIADYSGRKYSGGEWNKRDTTGLSVGASYVYMLKPNLGLKSGFDYDVFKTRKTHMIFPSSLTFNIGGVFTF